MTEQRVPYLLPDRDVPQEPQTLPLGYLTIRLDHPDFLPGYQQGMKRYDEWHSNDLSLDTATLLFLVRNGWGDRQHSVYWQTGYIVGWLHALFAHAYNLGEVVEP